MKIQFTEKFLWQLYGILENVVQLRSAIAPHSLQEALSPELQELRKSYVQKKRRQSFSQFISYLKRQGYIRVPGGYGIEYAQLTEKGKKKAFEANLKSKHWNTRPDGKMIMVIYDIPEAQKPLRQIFREFLICMNYTMLQKSVWISYKDVLRETERIIYEYHLEPCVKVFVLERIEVQKERESMRI